MKRNIRNILTASIGALALMTWCGTALATPANTFGMKVDIDGSGSSTPGSLTQTNFQSWPFVNAPTTTNFTQAFTYSDSLQSGTITVNLLMINTNGAMPNSRNRNALGGEYWGNLLTDFAYIARAAGGEGWDYLQFGLSGLLPNTNYEVTVWSYDPYNSGSQSFMAWGTNNPSTYPLYQPVVGGGGTCPKLARVPCAGPVPSSYSTDTNVQEFVYAGSFFITADGSGNATFYGWNDSESYSGTQMANMCDGFALGIATNLAIPPPITNINATTVNSPVPTAYGPPTVWPYTAGIAIPADGAYTDESFLTSGSTVMGETFVPTRDFLLRNFYIACQGSNDIGRYQLVLYDLGTGSAPASFNPSTYTNLLAQYPASNAPIHWSFRPLSVTNKTIVKFKFALPNQPYLTNGHNYFLGFQYWDSGVGSNDLIWERTTSGQTYANGTAYEGSTTSVANGVGGGNRNFIMAIDVLNPNPVISVANVALSTSWPASLGVPAIATFIDPTNMDTPGAAGESRTLINGQTISMSFIAPSNFNLGSIVLRQNGIGSSNVLFTVALWNVTNTFLVATDSVNHWPYQLLPMNDTAPHGIPVFGTNVDFYYTAAKSSGTNDQLLILSFPTAYQVPLTSGQIYAVEIGADTVGQNATNSSLFSLVNSTNNGTFQIELFPDQGHGAGYRAGGASGNTNYYVLPRMLWRTFTDPELYAGDVVGGDQKTPAAARTAVMAIYPPAPSIKITSVSRSGNNVALTWSPNSTVTGTYSVLRTNIVTAPRTNWPVIQTGLSATNYTDTTATGAKNFYIITSP